MLSFQTDTRIRISFQLAALHKFDNLILYAVSYVYQQLIIAHTRT